MEDITRAHQEQKALLDKRADEARADSARRSTERRAHEEGEAQQAKVQRQLDKVPATDAERADRLIALAQAKKCPTP